MTTINDLKKSAETHLDFAKLAGQRIYNLLVVEGTILNDNDMDNLAIANSRSWAGHAILNDIHAEKAEKLDADTANRLLRRFKSSLRGLLESKCSPEGLSVFYSFIIVLELVIKENDYEV